VTPLFFHDAWIGAPAHPASMPNNNKPSADRLRSQARTEGEIMLLPADRILSAITQELDHIPGLKDDSKQGALRASLEIGLSLLRHREREGGGAIQAQLKQLSATLAPVVDALKQQPVLRSAVEQLLANIQSTLSANDGHSLERQWRELLAATESLIQQVGRTPKLDPDVHHRLSQALTQWEAGDLQQQLSQDQDAAEQHPVLDGPQLQHYLQQRFDDSALTVTRFQPLAGGFGKQTFLFEVEGSRLSGAFVMRRDTEKPLLNNDCHCIDNEYEVIRAAHAQGFPAPEAIWLDTEHRLLPGGHFLVMKRSPGEPGGSVFAAQGTIPSDLAQTLAGILARLHQLPALPALAQCNESINAQRWELSLSDCVERYLHDWFETFLGEVHLPSPAIVSQFNWLLANVPATPGKPVLLHGDIGFHNFLFDDGKLSAVLDWEFAHLGDPAEDLAYVRNTIGGALDWPAFIQAYEAAGGFAVDEQRVRFFQVWGHLRNAASANIAAAKFADGQAADLKLAMLPHLYIPQFLRAAQTHIDQCNEAAGQ
jgi:aminoglycoside phosphotransferase (APT) family kinase protein